MNIRSHLAEDRHAHFERMQCIFLARFWLGQLIGLYLFSRSSCCCYGMVIVFPHWTNDTRFLGRYVESIPRAKEIMHEWEPRKRRKHGKIRKKRVHIDMSDHWLCCMMSGISCHNQSQCDPMKKKKEILAQLNLNPFANQPSLPSPLIGCYGELIDRFLVPLLFFPILRE